MITINNITLSQEQSQPIIDNHKISIIIAGAGSGKTLTIVGKIKYMLENNLIKPNEICAITYTNKAVESLKQKIKEITPYKIDVYTFHKLSLEIIKKANIPYKISPENYLENIIDEYFQTKAFGNKTLLKCIYKHFHIKLKNNKNYQKILQSKKYQNFKTTITTFIKYMISNNLESKLKLLINNQKYQHSLLIIYSIYIIYQQELLSSNTLDFDKMIELATQILHNKQIKLPYKLVIIDEFQDTSLLRFNLIKELIMLTNASLTVVGDDYQSIYRFQGCDLSLFLNFSKYIQNAKTYFLTETYRNSQELIDIAGNFIQKNKNQISKQLKSQKHLSKPIKIIYYQQEKTILLKLLKEIPTNKNILILGRNNFDIKNYLDNYSIQNNILTIPNDNHKLKYLTIHSSKGLESDIVIIINMKNNTYGLPSKIKEDKLLKTLKSQEEYPYAEERRLFYVALTRTKSYTYILVPKNKPSQFIKEIKSLDNILIKKYK